MEWKSSHLWMNNFNGGEAVTHFPFSWCGSYRDEWNDKGENIYIYIYRMNLPNCPYDFHKVKYKSIFALPIFDCGNSKRLSTFRSVPRRSSPNIVNLCHSESTRCWPWWDLQVKVMPIYSFQSSCKKIIVSLFNIQIWPKKMVRYIV